MNVAFYVLAQLSLVAVGAAIVDIVVLAAKRTHRWWAYALVKVSLGGIIGVLFLAVLPRRTVEGSWLAWVYMALVFLGCVGLISITPDLMDRAVRHENHEEVKP